MIRLYILLFFVINGLFSVFVEAQVDRADIASQLKRVRSRIVQTEKEISPLKKEEEEIRVEIKGLEVQVKSLFEEQLKLKARVEEIGKSQESLNMQMVAVRDQISKKKSTFEARVVHMFKTRRKLMPLSFLFGGDGNAEDFYRRSAYLRYLVQNDGNRLREFTSLLQTLRDSKEEFTRLTKEYEEKMKRNEDVGREFEKKQLELAKAVRQLDQKIAKLSKRLELYNSQEEEYESLLKDITKSSSETVEEQAKMGGGIRPRSLDFPVNGKIIQHFGKQKHGEFKDIVFVKGVEVETQENSPVKVVQSGEVVFSSELPGFGSVLIVDHGMGIMSLYGRIQPMKSVGEKVNSDEIIAKSGPKDADGRNFYFELRRDGKALNPERFFKSY